MNTYLSTHIGELAALATAFCWTFTSMAFESAGKKVGSLSVNLIRLVMALVLLSLYTLVTQGALLPLQAGAHAWFWLSLSGLIGFVIGDLLLFQAFVLIGARISMLLMSLSPPLTALFGWLILSEKLSLSAGLGMLLTLWGIALAVVGRAQKKGLQMQFHYPLKGILLALGGAAGQGMGLVLSKLGMGDSDPFMATQIRVIAGIAGFSVLFTLSGRWPLIVKALQNRSALGRIATGAFFGPFLGVSLSLLAIQHTSTGIAATLNSLTPVLIIPFAWFWFKEKITTREILGALLAVAGVSVFFIF